MSSQATIEKVRALLKAPLLPTDGIRKQSIALADHDVDINQLLGVADVADFVRRAYEVLLGRLPGDECLANWQRHLKSKSLSRIAFIQQLASSEEGQKRHVRVHGLDYVLAAAEGGSKPSTLGRLNMGRLRLGGRRHGGSVGSDEMELAAAIDMDRKVAAAERRIAQLAGECLEVIGHIEHRFNRLQPNAASAQPASFPMRERIQSKTDSAELLGKLAELSDRMAVCPADYLRSALTKQLECISRKAAATSQGDSTLHNWLVAGTGLYETLRSCQKNGVQLLSVATSRSDLGLVQSLGVNAREQSVLEMFEGVQPSTAGGVVLCGQLAHSGDDELLRCLLAAHRVIRPGGYLLVDETAEVSRANRWRMHAATEICGFKIAESKPCSAPMEATEMPTLLVANRLPVCEVSE